MQKSLFLVLFFFLFQAQAQELEKLNSAEIYSEIEKLNFLGSALYIAAHPDDENTRLISYLNNELHARTAYLSITRGDGGQNLIGPQLREMLGVIRTEELLEARKIDGGEQFFTRANDFGYSKTPAETLKIWNEEEVLKDVVRIIRRFKPDIIINRFDANSAGETHGHHTASAILSTRAFEIADKNDIFQDQIKDLGTWRPKKLFFNTSFWFYGSQEAFDAADKSKLLQLDIGTYYPLKGLSNNEIAALSRSRHQSQGFGSTGTRGSTIEYLELLAGEQPPNNNELFFGINTTWSRINGGKAIGKILSEVQNEFDFKNPAASVPKLLQARRLIQKLEDEHWRTLKLSEIDEIILACSGIYLEAAANTALVTPGEEVNLNLEAINRSPLLVELVSVSVSPTDSKMAFSAPLLDNEVLLGKMTFQIPEDFSYTSPYWLQNPRSLGMYRVENTENIGLPETPRLLQAQFLLKINGTEINFSKNVIFKYNDPVTGETYRPFEVVPAVSVSSKTGVLLFPNAALRQVPVTVKAYKENVSGELLSGKTNGWEITPGKFTFGPLKKGEEKTFFFEIKPPKKEGKITFSPLAQVGEKQYGKAVIQLEYPHIPVQTLVLPNEVELLKPEFQKRGNLVGYIEGAGDEVPQALQEMGYKVDILNPESLTAAALSKYDAIVTGIRAYNTVEVLSFKQPLLLEYVKNGGNLILQYNTSHALVTENLAPYPLELSRGRVTEEDSEVKLLAKNHPALNFPNKITAIDFQGWIQERGLYFPDKWGAEFRPLLSMHDSGEDALEGSLLVAPYGKGYFVYTGLSFFRELPAGVAGAYRLFANLISLGKESSPAQNSSH